MEGSSGFALSARARSQHAWRDHAEVAGERARVLSLRNNVVSLRDIEAEQMIENA